MRMIITTRLFITSILSLALVACSAEQSNPTVDLIIINAKIFTSDADQPWAEALVVKDGKFAYVGDTSGLDAFKSTKTIDLEGRLLIPAMVDAHAHPGYVNVEKFGYVEGDAADELLASVKAYADAHPDEKWLRLCCWPTAMFVSGDQGPNRKTLDAILPDRLVWFESETAHDYWINSKAMAELGITRNTPDPRPGLAMFARDENGEPTGWLKEGAGVQYFAKHFALQDPDHIQLHKESVERTLQTISGHGVTALFDAGNKGFGDHTYRVISDLEKEGKLPVRYFGTYQIFTPERAKSAIAEVKRYRRDYGGELLQFRSVKLFMDGITANRSAAYSVPYVGDTKAGTTMLSVEETRDLLVNLHKAQLDLHVHSIGDLATTIVLDAVEEAHAIIGRENFYPRYHRAFGLCETVRREAHCRFGHHRQLQPMVVWS